MAKKKPKPVRTPAPPEAKPKLRLEWRSPTELAENPANWRRHPEAQIAALTDTLAEVGWAGALLYNERTGRLIDGHGRRKVALSQGSESVPVLVGDWSEEDERKILATLDPLAAMAEADDAALKALLAGIDTQSQAINAMFADMAPAPELPAPGGGGDEFDASPAESGPTRTNVGEVWEIGPHRLAVGDCTDPAVVAILMGGEKAGLCFTSPPYAQQRDYGEAAKEKVQDWHALMCGAFAALPMTDAGQVLVNLGLIHREGEWVPYWDEWIGWMRAQGWRRFGWYVWDQGPGMPGDWNGRLAPSFEFVWHFNRDKVRPEKTVPCKNAGKKPHGKAMRNAKGEVNEWSTPDKPHGTHRIPDSVIRVMRHKARGVECEHPAVYPVGLPSIAIESWPGDIYDPFLGSGTTLIAAHRLGRVCYGCEIEPRYADVILRRAEAEGMEVRLAD